MTAGHILTFDLYQRLLPRPKERPRERPPLPKPPEPRLTVLLLPDCLRLLPPKPEPVARLPVLRFLFWLLTVELERLRLPVERKTVRFLTDAGGAL